MWSTYLVAGVLGVFFGSVSAVATGSSLVGSAIGSVGVVFVAFLVSSWMASVSIEFCSGSFDGFPEGRNGENSRRRR
jgi:hypothetical protein